MTGNKLFDSCRMFKHACAFRDCAHFCETEPWDVEHRMASHTVSGIVNSAFACEIFIKSLLIYNDYTIEDIKGHELNKLWEKLKQKDEELTNSVEKKMEEVFCSNGDYTFSDLLNNISNAFEYWRYIYEKSSGTIYINFLKIFRDLLRNVCCEKLYNLTWAEYTKGNE